MCHLCEEIESGEMLACSECCRLICFDVRNDDDVVAQAGPFASDVWQMPWIPPQRIITDRVFNEFNKKE